MNNKNIYVEDFYQTTLQNDLSSSWDLEIQVSNPPKNKKWFLILTPENQSTREGVFYHNVDWNTIYVKEINRRELKEHYTWEKIQINDTSLIFNYLSEVSYTAFYAEKTGDLSVTIWGWLILKWLEEIEISDTDLTLDDNTTTYFYIDLTDNTIKGSTTASWIVLWEITTAGWKITSIWYKKHWISIWNFIENIAKTSSDWLIDTYTITLSDWSTKTFEVTNGRGINSIDKTKTDALTDTYTITYNDNTTSTFDVVNGRSVNSIDKTSSDWLTDTYTITYNDDTTSTFDVVNWHDIEFKWEYDDTVDYIKYDSVYLNNKTYVALEDNTWENPETSDSWQILISWDVLSLPVYTVSNVTEDREFDADNYTTDELADVLWTLINDVTKWIKWNDWLWVPAGWTTGQILAKVSDTDNDTEWKDEAQWGHKINNLEDRTNLNFTWDWVSVSDDSDNDATVVDIQKAGSEKWYKFRQTYKPIINISDSLNNFSKVVWQDDIIVNWDYNTIHDISLVSIDPDNNIWYIDDWASKTFTIVLESPSNDDITLHMVIDWDLSVDISERLILNNQWDDNNQFSLDVEVTAWSSANTIATIYWTVDAFNTWATSIIKRSDFYIY